MTTRWPDLWSNHWPRTCNGGLPIRARGRDLEQLGIADLLVTPDPVRIATDGALWGADAERAGTSRVTWEIEPVGDSCRLTLVHDQLPPDAPAELYGGWPMILSGLKTWLETGETLTTPGSLMYQRVN